MMEIIAGDMEYVVWLLCFVLGVLATFGVVIGVRPIGTWLTDYIYTGDYIRSREMMLSSTHAIATVVRIVKVDGHISEVRLEEVSLHAARFFGSMASENIMSVSRQDLLVKLRAYMDEDDYLEFLKDQKRLFSDLDQGYPLKARVPVIFNNEHPHLEYRGRAFLPVIVGMRTPRTRDKRRSEQLVQTAYLDVEDFAYATRLQP